MRHAAALLVVIFTTATLAQPAVRDAELALQAAQAQQQREQQAADNYRVGVYYAVLVFAALYFVPWIVAARRRHPNTQAIAVLNVLAGWTFLGWVVAIVWASTAIQPPQST